MIEYLKMYIISVKIINFITKAMETCKVELTTVGQTQNEVNIQIIINLEDSHSSLLFLIAMMPLNLFRKFTGGNKFTKSQENIIFLIYMDDIKIFAKIKKNRKH